MARIRRVKSKAPAPSQGPIFRGEVRIENGEPFYAALPEDQERCCDCGLTHRIKYRIETKTGDPIKGARLRMTVWRNERSTAATRRAFKFEKD